MPDLPEEPLEDKIPGEPPEDAKSGMTGNPSQSPFFLLRRTCG
jgi:hypothetical protein